MKKSILAIIMAFGVLSCSTSKKTAESKEKATTEQETVSSGKSETAKETKTKATATDKTDKKKSETVIKYTPKVNESTGKYEPFAYTEKQNGVEKTTVVVDGNGDVLIRILEDQVNTLKTETKEDIENLKLDFENQIKSQNKSLLEKESEIVTKSTSIWRLWIAVILLGLLLLASLYWHFLRSRK